MDSVFIALAFSGCSMLLVILREFFLWLRTKIPRSVQCWFCHSKTKVEYSISNSWFCSNCEQYNGFNKDGSYNRILDNQYEEKLNVTVTSFGRSKTAWKSINRLCDKCNHNQELKVQQLAAFVPLNEKNYDIEIEHYKAQLEKSYKLCSKCEGLISQIFSNERSTFTLPRRLLVSTVMKPEVTGIGRLILYMNLLVSLLISITAYVNLEGIPPILSAYLNESNNSTSSTIQTLLLQHSFYLLPSGLLLNILAWINTFSIGLLLNSTSWFIVLLLSIYPAEYKHYIIALQAISGIVSCAVSVICLTSNRKRRNGKSKNSSFEWNKVYAPQFSKLNVSNSDNLAQPVQTFEENNTTPHVYQKCNKLTTPPSPPAASLIGPLKTSPILRQQKNWADTINMGIRSLNLGQNSVGKNVSKRNYIYNNSIDTPWWLNSGVKHRNNRSSNMTGTGSKGSGAGPHHSLYSSTRPPSTPSSGFSDDLDDVDDAASCTGHSPVCKHYSCQMMPPPSSSVQCAYYYAAAHFQRLLSTTPPSPPLSFSPLSTSTSYPATPVPTTSTPYVHNTFNYLYMASIIILIASNLAVLWTVHTKDSIKG